MGAEKYDTIPKLPKAVPIRMARAPAMGLFLVCFLTQFLRLMVMVCGHEKAQNTLPRATDTHRNTKIIMISPRAINMPSVNHTDIPKKCSLRLGKSRNSMG